MVTPDRMSLIHTCPICRGAVACRAFCGLQDTATVCFVLNLGRSTPCPFLRRFPKDFSLGGGLSYTIHGLLRGPKSWSTRAGDCLYVLPHVP